MRRLENEQTYSNKLVDVLVVISQRGHSQNVMTSHRNLYDIILTLCVCLEI